MKVVASRLQLDTLSSMNEYFVSCLQAFDKYWDLPVHVFNTRTAVAFNRPVTKVMPFTRLVNINLHLKKNYDNIKE